MQFEKLDDYWLDYLESGQHSEHSWEKGLLHVSDLCSCPRMVGMRLLGMEKRPLTRPEKWSKLNMFFLANFLHEQQYVVWSRGGILVEKELSIRGYLPEGWTGRFDAVLNYGGDNRIVDVKTVAYLAKKASYPYLKHIAQTVCYHEFIKEDLQLSLGPLLYYIQRDLSHDDGIEASVNVSDETSYFMKSEMKKLEDMKSNLPDLAPMLPMELKYTGRKKKGEYQEISVITNSKCSTKWCDYSCHSCQPPVGNDLAAYRVGPDWVPTPFGEQPEVKENIQQFISEESYDEL